MQELSGVHTSKAWMLSREVLKELRNGFSRFSERTMCRHIYKPSFPLGFWWFCQHSCLGSLVAEGSTSTSDKCVSTSVITARIKHGDLKKGMTGNHEWKILWLLNFTLFWSNSIKKFLPIFSNEIQSSHSGNAFCSLPDLPCQVQWRALEVAPR